MREKLSLPRPNDLMELPLRAIVAYAVRCARRAQPLFCHVSDIADFAQHEAAVERAISLAERFCFGNEIESRTLAAAADEAAYAADAAAFTATVAAYAVIAADGKALARVAVATKAAAAASAVAYAARAAAARGATARAAAADAAHAAAADASDAAAAVRDFEALLDLYSGGWSGLGATNNVIDPTEHGPLGALWPPPTRFPTAAVWFGWTTATVGSTESSPRA
jgi:hypothetical protein